MVKVERIVWVKHDGEPYGVAVDSRLNPLGNVRIEKRVRDFYMVAYNFLNGGWCANIVPLYLKRRELSELALKQIGETRLRNLVEAA